MTITQFLLSCIATAIVSGHFLTLLVCNFLLIRDDLLQKYFYKNGIILTSCIYGIFTCYIGHTLNCFDHYINLFVYAIYCPVAFSIFIKVESIIANSFKILTPLLMIIALILLNPPLQNNIYLILATIFMTLVAFYQLANIKNTLCEIDKEIQDRNINLKKDDLS